MPPHPCKNLEKEFPCLLINYVLINLPRMSYLIERVVLILEQKPCCPAGRGPPYSRFGHTLTILNNKAYLFGGRLSENTDPNHRDRNPLLRTSTIFIP